MFTHLAIDTPLRTLFTYRVPNELAERIKIGSRVIAPFGKKKVIGICAKLTDRFDASTDRKGKKIRETDLKEIIDVIEEDGEGKALIDKTTLEWLVFAADYYCAPIGQVLAQAIPSHYFDIKKISKKIRTHKTKEKKKHSFTTKTVTLTDEQSKVAAAITKHLNKYYPVLLHGITGSGKTEIYIHIIKEVLAAKKSVLLLVPEIGLTPQMIARLEHHFDKNLLLTHSGLTKNQRHAAWNACQTNEPTVLVGTRSAIFAPFTNLGLIIVDEEQDSSYKQEDRFRYNARDLAVSRAQRLNIPIILGSATPSLESYYLAHQKKYAYFDLPERVGNVLLPEIRMIDLGREKELKQHSFLLSTEIHEQIKTFYQNREQMIVFVGQRGFAQNAYCTDCHEIQTCPNCSVGLKFHKPTHALKCHYCDFQRPFDEQCSSCSKKALTLLGFGIQGVEDELRTMHPTMKIARLDSDAMTSTQKLHDTLNDFAAKKINLLIGTQMVSKGHDFDGVGFVGVVGIDAHLGLPDFRAAERSFQNLVQVAGRAGRSIKRGLVMVQTLNPRHAAIQRGIHHDFKSFAADEIAVRKILNYPPFTRMIQFRFSSNSETVLKNFFEDWKPFLKRLRTHTTPQNVAVMGPAEMPIAKLRGKFRHHLCLKVPRGIKFQGLVHYILADLEKRRPKKIQWQVDVDPMGMM